MEKIEGIKYSDRNSATEEKRKKSKGEKTKKIMKMQRQWWTYVYRNKPDVGSSMCSAYTVRCPR